MGDFDKIIKENIEAVFLPLAGKLLGINIHQHTELPEKIQTTVEREPDFLEKIIDEEGNEFILHLEFQTTDEPKIVYRMAEYKALLQRKYELPVKQYVIYLGTKTPKMRTILTTQEQITGFNLKNIHDLPATKVLDSDIPEEIILSILANFPETEAESIISRIITRLRRVTTDEATLKRYVQ